MCLTSVVEFSEKGDGTEDFVVMASNHLTDSIKTNTIDMESIKKVKGAGKEKLLCLLLVKIKIQRSPLGCCTCVKIRAVIFMQ